MKSINDLMITNSFKKLIFYIIIFIGPFHNN